MELISDLMIKEHLKIKDFLEELGNLEFDFDEAFFNNFKWILEKHFFVEERAIFNITDKLFGEEVSEVFELMKQHGEILEVVNSLDEDLPRVNKAKIKQLINLLVKHSDYEDVYFYPKLDKVLNDNQKRELVLRIKEVLRDQ